MTSCVFRQVVGVIIVDSKQNPGKNLTFLFKRFLDLSFTVNLCNIGLYFIGETVKKIVTMRAGLAVSKITNVLYLNRHLYFYIKFIT